MAYLISIVMPVYNVGEYLDSTLLSVREQTYREWELLLVDDGSTDQSREIAEHHAGADSRIRIISQNRQGVSVARNRGLGEAIGEFVIFFDADDLWLPHSLQRLVEKQLQSEMLMVYGAQQHLREDGKLDQVGSEYPSGYILQATIREDFVHIGASLINRLFLLRNNLQFTPQATRAQDVEFILKILSLIPVASLAETVQIRRYRSGSATNSEWSWEQELHSISCYERSRNFIRQNYQQSDQTQALLLLSRKIAYLRFRALWKHLKKGHSSEVLACMQDPAWWEPLQELDLRELTWPQRIQLWLLQTRNPWLWLMARQRQ